VICAGLFLLRNDRVVEYWTLPRQFAIHAARYQETLMSILNTLLRAVTWWNGQTLNTQLYTWRKGVKVGEDEQGNVFYRDREDKRRWVIFNGEAEASRVGADWHGWLHHTYHEPPTDRPLDHKAWEKPHEENLTGTALAYAPAGSIRRTEPVERRDYEAWSPE
jgi:NADH:ubiquinone oxidoreductase subunit